MTSSTEITVVRRCSVSPPPLSVSPTTLPLTFFDIPWLIFSPSQPLFFYEFPISTSHFTQTIFPKLKNSLSHTLQHFFPLAGKLASPPQSVEPIIKYSENDSISLTIAEAAAGSSFKNLAGNHPRPAQDFHNLVPELKVKSLLAIQITVFPENGICIGFTLRHVVADGRTFNNFLKNWASNSITKNGQLLGVDRLLTSIDRSVIIEPNGVMSKLMEDLLYKKSPRKGTFQVNGSIINDTMKATFLLGPNDMDKIKTWILTRSEKLFGSTQLLLSPYVVVCSFVWVCWMKSHWSITEEDDTFNETIHYFGFIAGGITRLHFPVPSNYLGNCVSFGRVGATRNQLMGENGVVHAAKLIGDTIKRLNGDVLGGANNWILEWKELHESELHVTITGSPKVDSYGLDFGWGKPMKIEEVSIDKTRAISLCESREVVGGIEIGLALPKPKMDVFSSLFNKRV